MNRQEIVAALVCHSSSPLAREADGALSVLSDISNLEIKFEERARDKKRKYLQNLKNKNKNKNRSNGNENETENEKSLKTFHGVTLRNFVSFLKTLLEDVSVLSESHLRSIFRIIFQCTCVAEEPVNNSNNNNNTNNNNNSNNTNNNNERDVQWSFRPPDDVMILLKKFSGSVNISLRRISIIGYVAYLAELRAFCCSFKIKDSSAIGGADGEEEEDDGDRNGENGDGGNGDREKGTRGGGGSVRDEVEKEVEEGGLEEEGIKVLNMMVSSVADDTAGLVFLVSEEWFD
jgi:hypothetical protein